MVGLSGLEPPTSPLSGVRSNHLSYRPNVLSQLSGGACRDRTDDPLLAKQVLYQLSYAPSILFSLSQSLVGLVGLEPTTPRLSSVCSNHLSYKPVEVLLLIFIRQSV